MHLDLLSESHRFYSLGTIFNDSFVDRSQKIFKEEISFENNVVSDGNSSFIF